MLFFGASPSIPRYIFGFQIDFWILSKDLAILVYIALLRLWVSAPLRELIPSFCSIWDICPGRSLSRLLGSSACVSLKETGYSKRFFHRLRMDFTERLGAVEQYRITKVFARKGKNLGYQDLLAATLFLADMPIFVVVILAGSFLCGHGR